MEPEFKSSDAVLLRRYLLGELAEGELDSVEERLFSNEPFWEHMCLIEDDLIDEYVTRELRGGQREHFEKNFLSSPRRRERVAMARGWLIKSRAPVTNSGQPWLASLRLIFRPKSGSGWMPPLGSWAPVAAVTVVLVAGVLMFEWNAELARQRKETAALSQRIQELASRTGTTAAAPQAPGAALMAEMKEVQRRIQSLAAAASKTATLSLILMPGAQRAVGQSPQKLMIPRGDQAVQLLLQLTESRPYVNYRVVIQTFEGVEVWGAINIGASHFAGGSSLPVTAPSKAFKEGDYRVLVSGVTAAGQAEELNDYYVFHAVLE